MANDKKFIVKNGLQSQENVVIGTTVDNGVNKLQVTGSTKLSGYTEVTQPTANIPSININNSGGSAANSIVARFTGDASSIDIVNFGLGDYSLFNTNQSNGFKLYNDTAGVEIVYNNSVDIAFTDTGIDFKREPTYNGFVFWNAGNDGSGSGLDADLIDGLDSTQFLRSDEDDTMNGSLTITGNLTVNGTTTYINTEEILLSDNIITLNANYTGSTPTENAGIEVERGTLANPKLVWNETSDFWQLEAENAVIGRIITTADEAVNGGNFDADTVDGLQAEQFLRSDVDDVAAGNIRIQGDLTVGDGNGTANIILDGAGTNGQISALNGEVGFLGPSFNFAIKVKTDGDIEVRDDIFAQRYFDKNNNAYYMDLDGSSVVNNIGIDADLFHNGDTDTKLSFVTDQIRLNTGGVTRLTIANASVTSTVDVVAPRFVDSADNNYYADPAATSVMKTIDIDDYIRHNGDTNTYLGFSAADTFKLFTNGTEKVNIDTDSADFSVLLTAPTANIYSGGLTGSANIGISANERFNFEVTDGQGYIRYYQDETDATDHSVNFEIQSSGIGLNEFRFNSNVNVPGKSVLASFGLFSSGVYSPVYYDYNNELFYASFASTGISVNAAGTIQAGNGSLTAPTYTFGSDNNTGMYRFAADTIGFSAGGNDELRIYTSYVLAPGSMRSPIFYDSDNTAYYGNFAGSSVMNTIGIDSDLFHNGDTDTKISFATDSISLNTANVTRLAINTTAVTASLNTYAPRFYTDDYLVHTGDENTYIGFNAADTFGVWTNGVNRLSINATSATFGVDVYAPRYYDSNNNAYYVDPAADSVMNTIILDDYIIHNGDTNSYFGFDAADNFGVWLNGAQAVDIDANGNMGLSTAADASYKLNVNGNYKQTTSTNAVVTIAGNVLAMDRPDTGPFYINNDGGPLVSINTVIEADNVNKRVLVGGGNLGYTADAVLSIMKGTTQGNNPFASGNALLSLGDAGVVDYTLRTDSFGNIFHVNDNGGNEIWYDSGAGGRFAILNDGNVIVGNDSVTFQNTDATTNFIATPDANKFHISGSIQMEGVNNVISIGAADASNTAINEATFLATNELGFGAGGGFYMDETTTVKVRGNKNLSTSGNITGGNVYAGNVYASRYYDADNNAYYADPASASVFNTLGIDSDLFHNGDTDNKISFGTDTITLTTGNLSRLTLTNNEATFRDEVYAPYYITNDYLIHNGDTDTYLGFNTSDSFVLNTGGAARFLVNNTSATFTVNTTAPNFYAARFYDSDNNAYYADPAGTSIFNGLELNNPSGDTVLKFGPGLPGSDDAHIEWKGASNGGYLRFSTADDNGTEYMEFGDYDNVNRGGAFTRWALLNRDRFEHTSDIRAPIFYDYNDTGYYGDFAGTSVMNVVRANQYQLDGSAIIIDSPTGEYGSIQVSGAKNGWAGYAINDDWVFMSNGTTNAGIYNDTRNEWHVYMQDNNFTRLYANGTHEIGAENGYGFAPNSMRSPIFYDSDNTAYYGNFGSGNTAEALKINGRILREGFNTAGTGTDNYLLRAQDANHYIWATGGSFDWGMFWNTNSASAYRDARFGDNTISFVGAGNLRALIDLDSGDIMSYGEMYAGNYNISAGNESVPLNPAYGAGTSELKLFDGNLYWEKRAIDALRGSENSPTTATSEYVKSTDAPGSSSYVLRTAAYRDYYSDLIEVEPGEEIYGEMWVKFVSGSGGLFYYGVEQYDKDKRPIATNTGTTYFVAAGVNVTSTSWQKFSGHHTVPTTHTVYNGSDGGGVRYVRIRILMNYNAGGALREFTAPILMRSTVQSRIRTDQAVYSPIYYDLNDTNFYLDPASTSKLNTVDASNFRDRDNTARYMDPASGGSIAGTWNFNNGNITNVNNIQIGDPGPGEGIEWIGGNNWKIYESPDDLTTNTGGNLQFVTGSTFRMRIDANSDVTAGRYMRAQRFYDSNNGAYYADPAGRSVLADVIVQSSKASSILDVRRTGSAPGNNVTALFSNEYSNHSWGLVAEFRTEGNAGGDRPSINWSSALSANSWSAGMFDGNNWGVRFNHGYRHGGWGTEVFRVDTGRNLTVSNNLNAANVYASRFYDSDNAAYYLDPASGSNVVAITAGAYYLDNGWAIYDDNAETLSIRSNNSDHGYVAFRDSDGTECGRIEFDDDGFWGLKTPSNEWAVYMERDARVYTYYNGTWEERTGSGHVEARLEYRAPIFRDSNDPSNFYGDFNGTSRLRGLTTIDVITSPGITGYSSALVRRDNRIISPSADTSGQLKFGFTSWANNNTAPWADYLHLRSYTDASGGSDNLLMFRKDTFGMRLWQQTWNSTTAYATYRNVTLYNENPGSGNSLYADILYDTDDPVYRVDPTGISHIKHLEVAANDAGAADYWRAAIEVREYNYGGAQTDEYRIAPRIGFHWGGRVASQIALASNGEIRIINNPGNATENFRANTIFADNAFYGQRFYDSNNSGYYTDPASTSIMVTLDIRGEVYNDGWFRNDTSGRGLYSTPHAMHWYADTNERWRLYSTANTAQILFTTAGNVARGYVYADNSNNIGFLNNGGGWALRTNGSTTEVYGNLYADIMYDRNNPAYYVNPAGTTQLNTVFVDDRIYFNGSVSGDDRRGIFFDGGTSEAYAIFREGGGWGFPYPDLRIAFHTGIKLGANASYNGIRFYTDYDMSGQVMSVNNANDPLGGGNVYVNNNLQAGSSLRAPIFYDSDDTTYRMDMHSTNASRFRGVQSETMAYLGLSGQTRSSKEYYAARPRITGDSNYWTGAMGWGRIDMNTIGDWGSGFIDSWSNPPNQPSGTSHWVGVQAYHYTNGSSRYGWQMVGGPIENLRFRSSWGGFRTWRTIPVLNVNDNNGGAMYANIYYDTDNTGFYCDPSAFSNFNTGLRATDIYARDWFRNDNSGEGLYNQATGVHYYSPSGQYANITGNNNNSSMNLQLKATYQGNIRMWLHGDAGISQGFLNTAGAWKMRSVVADGYSPTWWFHESGDETWTGNPAADEGKVEYHANRFYIASGTNSNRIVQFRQGGSDRSYIANDGVFVGTATSARWADLAERYEADAIYEPGTILGINLDGDSEVTLYQPGMPVAGAVSTNPAYRMNEHIDYNDDNSVKSKMNPFIALKGRIPVKVNGEVRKGQWVIADKDGKGRGVDYGTPGINTFDIIGIALSNSENGEVEVKV